MSNILLCEVRLSIRRQKFGKGDILFNYSNKDKLTEFFTDNFYGTRACCLVFPLPFAFAINYLLYDEKVFYICRMKNRMQYITQCVLNIIAFSFICAFFHEAVNQKN